MKIALFGGRFDPVHNGHLAVAREVLHMKVADEVWFSLENQHQWRPIVASVVDRRTMLELATKGEKRFKIDMTPIQLGGLTETLSVVRKLRKTVIDDILFVVGSDQLPTFPQWTHWDELQQEINFLLIARKGYPIKNIPKSCTVIEDPNYEPLEDSATRIRDFIKQKKSITGLVPKKVEDYIVDKGLYK